MFIVRLLCLSLFTLFCYGMGTIPAGEANGIALTFGPLFFIAAPLLYFLPTVEGWLRGHHQMAALGALNLLLGWTIIGWVGAFVWALTAKPKEEAPSDGHTPEPSWMRDPSLKPGSGPGIPAPAERECPFCAETIKAAAIVCKHCGRDLPQAVA